MFIYSITHSNILHSMHKKKQAGDRSWYPFMYVCMGTEICITSNYGDDFFTSAGGTQCSLS